MNILLPSRLSRVLTNNQERFIAAYLADPRHNPATAAIAAGYSARTAKTQGYALLRKPHVRRACVMQNAEGVTSVPQQPPMERAEALKVLSDIARTGDPAHRLTALRMLAELQRWDKATPTLSGFAASIHAADQARRSMSRGEAPGAAPAATTDDELLDLE